ncbi:hypothetical protein [Photobacterium lipolyticum]|uniref:hypothetical protein n=1 Tax=Photobacterium lipolyticum TaxID=266810 RepID=UPI0011B24982|nr:hypothetical protein [Photobacterium lipolyticum]
MKLLKLSLLSLSLISSSAFAFNAERLNLAICLDASFSQGRATYNKIYSQWESDTSHLTQETADSYQFKGRDFRKIQMVESGLDRKAQRKLNWEQRNCSKFI